jgi:hypothetical protein
MGRYRKSQVEAQYVILAVYQIHVWEIITLIVNFFTRDMNIKLWLFINR